MSLTDEQLQQAIIDGVKAGKISWTGYKTDNEGRFTIPAISKSDMQLSRAIESAATAPLLERIAELEHRCQDHHEDMLRFRRHALDEKDARMALERELEVVRNEVLDEAAKCCDEIEKDRWALYKGRPPYTGQEKQRASDYTQGESDGASQCADDIRELKDKKCL